MKTGFHSIRTFNSHYRSRLIRHHRTRFSPETLNSSQVEPISGCGPPTSGPVRSKPGPLGNGITWPWAAHGAKYVDDNRKIKKAARGHCFLSSSSLSPGSTGRGKFVSRTRFRSLVLPVQPKTKPWLAWLQQQFNGRNEWAKTR